MINLENVAELVSVELNRARIAITNGKIRTAKKHLDRVDELNILWDTMEAENNVING